MVDDEREMLATIVSRMDSDAYEELLQEQLDIEDPRRREMIEASLFDAIDYRVDYVRNWEWLDHIGPWKVTVVRIMGGDPGITAWGRTREEAVASACSGISDVIRCMLHAQGLMRHLDGRMYDEVEARKK